MEVEGTSDYFTNEYRQIISDQQQAQWDHIVCLEQGRTWDNNGNTCLP